MEKNKLYGSHLVLTRLPVWATAAILFALTQIPILVGRDVMEGLPYNVAYSATIGDIGLAIIAFIAATVLQRWGFSLRRGIPLPGWLQGKMIHKIILSVSVVVGIIVCELTLSSRSGQLMDVYHDVIIAPLFLYLAITLLPIIFMNGTKVEKRATVCLILLWVGLVGFDIKYDRLNQLRWLKNHGEIFQTHQAQEEPQKPPKYIKI